jgi:lysozyme
MSRGTPADVNAALRLAMLTFAEDKAKYEARVRSAVHVPVRPWQFDALFSFDLNTGGIFSARLTQLLNSGAPPSTVADAFFGWLQPPEIKSRRQQEAHLFETGDYRSDDPGVLIPVYTVGPTNHPQLLKQVSYSELIKLVS